MCIEVCKNIESPKTSRTRAESFIKEPLAEFDEEIFHRLVQEVRIGSEDDVEVVWSNGML